MKVEPCPFCGQAPDRMGINGIRVVTCLPCHNRWGPMGQHSVAKWNEQAKAIRKALRPQEAQPCR